MWPKHNMEKSEGGRLLHACAESHLQSINADFVSGRKVEEKAGVWWEGVFSGKSLEHSRAVRETEAW